MAAPSAISGGSLTGVRVLLAEDMDDSREMLAEFMRLFGIDVVEACSGTEALAKFKAAPPALVVSDIAMPEGDGLSLVEAIRALDAEEGGLTPAIAVSAHAEQERAILAGFNVFLQKPVDPAVLVDVIRNFVERSPGGQPTRSTWTVHSPRAGQVVIRYVGHLSARDSEAAIEALVRHLERGDVEVVADLRDLTGFEPAATLRGQRAAWRLRKRITALTIVGGSALARAVTMAAARLMGIPCRVTDEPPAST